MTRWRAAAGDGEAALVLMAAVMRIVMVVVVASPRASPSRPGDPLVQPSTPPPPTLIPPRRHLRPRVPSRCTQRTTTRSL